MRNNVFHIRLPKNWKNQGIVSIIIFMTAFMSSCSLLEGIFQAGMGLGILIAVAIVALVIFIVARFSRSGRS
jgi:hypothetical protein